MFIENAHYPVAAWAIEETYTCGIRKSDFEQVILAHPAIGLRVISAPGTDNSLDALTDTVEPDTYIDPLKQANVYNQVIGASQLWNTYSKLQGKNIGVAVVDSGIAKVKDPADGESLTRTGTMMGTSHYMAPEQIRGRPPDERTDLFTLGAVLYEMLTGEPPFPGETFPEVFMAILGQPVPDVQRVAALLDGQPSGDQLGRGRPQRPPSRWSERASDPDARRNRRTGECAGLV